MTHRHEAIRRGGHPIVARPLAGDGPREVDRINSCGISPGTALFYEAITMASPGTLGRRMMRALVVGCAVLVTAVAGTFTTPAFAQSGYDRPGGDYISAPVANGDPAVCAIRCEHEKNCRAWSFSYPPASGGPAMCWLKREVVPRVAASCCVSGVRGAGVIEPRVGVLEYSIDRFGGDYRAFETTPDPKGKPCADACQAETRCRAWTYRRAGYGATAARCFLKETIKPPRRRPCCISGVVR